MKKGALAVGIILLFLLIGCKSLKQVSDAEESSKAEESQEEVPQVEYVPSDIRASQEPGYINGPDDATIQRICADEDWPPDCNEIPFPQGVEMCKRCKVISEEAPIPESDDKFIFANPLDLSQISRISKFRSCYGHDYSGLNIDGERETLRSMKHYIEFFRQFLGSENTVKVFAPFNGKIAEIIDAGGKQVFISADSAPTWHFIFFHINPEPDIKEGIHVKAGQLIGYAYVREWPNFDFALKEFGKRGQIFESPFLHMEDSILKEYVSYGVTPENIIISKEVRDNNPCQVQGTRDGAAAFPGPEKDDFVALK